MLYSPPAARFGRIAWLSALALATCLGCERKSEQAKEAQSTQAGAAATQAAGAARGAPFSPPKLAEGDQRDMAMALEMKISSAYYDAANAPDDSDKVGKLGCFYFAHGFPAQAAVCFQRAAELKPREMAWWYAAGLAHETAGQRKEAVAAFAAAVALEKQFLPAFVHLADLLVSAEPARAAPLYQNALELQPVNARAAYGLGCTRAAQGRQDEALTYWRMAVGFAPDFAAAHRALADALKAAGQQAQAERHARLAAAGGPPPDVDDPVLMIVRRLGYDPEMICGDAVTVARQGQFERAETFIRNASDLGAGSRAWLALGQVRLLQRRFDEAAAEFRRVVEAEPDSLAAKVSLAQALTEAGNTGEAEQLLRAILAQQPDHVGAIQQFTDLMNRLGKPDEPIAQAQKALAADPDDATLHFWLAHLLVGQKRAAEAVDHYRKAIELRPEFIVARCELAMVLWKNIGDLPAAKLEAEGALHINPKLLEGYDLLAKLALAQKDWPEAERVLRQGLEKLPEAPDLANSLAWILAASPRASQRNGQEAVQWGEKACSLTQNSNHIYLDTLGAAYAAVGRFDDALRLTRQAVVLATQAGGAPQLEEYRRRIAMYEQNQPYHETE